MDRLLTIKQTAPLDATKDETYTYDPLNNLTTRAIGTPVTATTVNVHDAANQLLEGRSGTVAGALLAGYVYDANGSLTKKCVGGTVTRTATDCTATGGAVTSLTYDTLDRMTQAVAGAITESYAYDQAGKRASASVKYRAQQPRTSTTWGRTSMALGQPPPNMAPRSRRRLRSPPMGRGMTIRS